MTGVGGGDASLLLFNHHRLDRRGDAVLDLDLDHARSDGADRLLEVHVAAVDRDAARLLDRVHDVLRRDGAEEAAVVARLVRDRQDRAAQQRRGLLRGGQRRGGGLLDRLLALRGRGDGALGRRLRQLARDQVVAQVALGDVDHGAPLTERLVVLQKDGLRHGAATYRSRPPRPPRPPRSPSSGPLPSPTYGRSASSRARLTAPAPWFWCRRHAPVIRRERILPRSLTNFLRVLMSL